MPTYPSITQPTHLTQDMDDLSLTQIENLFKVFMKVKDSRILALLTTIFGKPIWPLPIAMLEEVDHFLEKNIAIHNYNEEEFNAKVNSRLNFKYLPQHLVEKEIARIPKYEFREPTFSLIYDIGALLGDLIILDADGVSWDLERDKKYFIYGHPILKSKQTEYVFSPSSRVRGHCGYIVEAIEKTKLTQIYERGKQHLCFTGH